MPLERLMRSWPYPNMRLASAVEKCIFRRLQTKWDVPSGAGALDSIRECEQRKSKEQIIRSSATPRLSIETSQLPLQATHRAWTSRRVGARIAFSLQISLLCLGCRFRRTHITWTWRQTGEQYFAHGDSLMNEVLGTGRCVFCKSSLGSSTLSNSLRLSYLSLICPGERMTRADP